MGQPVVDTLRLSDALRETGMEREQAEGVARTLGTELGAHVAVQSDLQVGLQGLRAEIQQVRSDLRAEIQQVDAKIDRVHAELGGKVDALRAEMRGLNSRVTLLMTGFAFLFSALTVASGMGLFERPAPHAGSTATVGTVAQDARVGPAPSARP